MSAVERDASDLRAQQELSALTALRETQLETLGRVDGLEQTVTDRFATVDRGLHQIVTLIEGLSEREP